MQTTAFVAQFGNIFRCVAYQITTCFNKHRAFLTTGHVQVPNKNKLLWSKLQRDKNL